MVGSILDGSGREEVRVVHERSGVGGRKRRDELSIRVRRSIVGGRELSGDEESRVIRGFLRRRPSFLLNGFELPIRNRRPTSQPYRSVNLSVPKPRSLCLVPSRCFSSTSISSSEDVVVVPPDEQTSFVPQTSTPIEPSLHNVPASVLSSQPHPTRSLSVGISSSIASGSGVEVPSVADVVLRSLIETKGSIGQLSDLLGLPNRSSIAEPSSQAKQGRLEDSQHCRFLLLRPPILLPTRAHLQTQPTTFPTLHHPLLSTVHTSYRNPVQRR